MARCLLWGWVVAALLAAGSPAAAANHALAFDGIDDRADCGDPVANQLDLLGDATLEAWVRVVTPPPGRLSPTAFAVVGKDVSGGDNVKKWIFGLQNGGLAFHINGPGYGTGRWVYSSSFTQPFGSCYHVAIVKTGDSYAFFVDGAAAGGGATDPLYDVPAPLTIGFAEVGLAMAGEIDELRIWNVARSASDIDANKGVALTGNETGLVAYYTMNHSGNMDALDKTPNGFDGVLGGPIGPTDRPQYVNSCSAVPFAASVPTTNAWMLGLLGLGLVSVASFALVRASRAL